MHIILKISILATNVFLDTKAYCTNHLNMKFLAHTIINNEVKPISDPTGEIFGHGEKIYSSNRKNPDKTKQENQTKKIVTKKIKD